MAIGWNESQEYRWKDQNQSLVQRYISPSEWILDSYPIGRYVYSRFSSASELRWLPQMRKITPSKLKWILARVHLICRNGFVLSRCVLWLNGAADKRCQCVFAHLAALLTHWDFQKAFTQGEMPHGSNSLCKQNLTQNRPPVNSRQPRAHSYTLISHTNTFTLPSTTYRASQNSSFPHNNSFARSSLMPSHLRLRCH